MPNINWQFQAAIAGGPSVLLNLPGLTVAAYDVAAVDIPAGASSRRCSDSACVGGGRRSLSGGQFQPVRPRNQLHGRRARGYARAGWPARAAGQRRGELSE